MLISKDVKSDDYEVLRFEVTKSTLSEMTNHINLFKANKLSKSKSKRMKYDWQAFEILYCVNNRCHKKFISESECNSFLQGLIIINNRNREKNTLSEYLEYAQKLTTLP